MSWFERLTGFHETGCRETQGRLHVREGRLHSDASDRSCGLGTLELVSLAELRGRAQGIDLPGPLTLDIVEGDVRHLHADDEYSGAVFQVASQFNLLEMVDPSVSPEHGVADYEFDRTQGPACAIAAGAGTIYRNYLAPVGDQIGQTSERQLDGLENLGAALAQQMGVAPGTLWRMRNGYVLPDRGQLYQIGAHLSLLAESERDVLRGLLKVGLHRDVEVTDPGAAQGTVVTQAYCSALPVAYSGISPAAWTGFATLVLEAAYEATLLAGLLNAAGGGSHRILLTRIGGGAFGNDERWINTAILRALHLMTGQRLDVRMVSYSSPSAAMRSVEAAWRADDRA